MNLIDNTTIIIANEIRELVCLSFQKLHVFIAKKIQILDRQNCFKLAHHWNVIYY